MKAITAGGIEAVVKVINTHISNVNVCENGCSALWNMTANGIVIYLFHLAQS